MDNKRSKSGKDTKDDADSVADAEAVPTAIESSDTAKLRAAAKDKTTKLVLAIDHDACSPLLQVHARKMYEAYIANSAGLSWDGRKCPAWDDLGHAVKSHWCAAAKESLRCALKLSPSEFDLESR